MQYRRCSPLDMVLSPIESFFYVENSINLAVDLYKTMTVKRNRKCYTNLFKYIKVRKFIH